jgi:diadenosine tetraphosphate (Ap4A) HIT family hydrolase
METDGECVLCRRGADWPVVRESDLWLTVVNRNQNLLGKTFIVVRRHEEDVAGLRLPEWAALQEELRWVTERVRAAFAPDHFNYSFLMNLDRHVHLHVIPRYVGTRELAEVTFADSDYPDAYRRTSDDELASDAVVEAVARALRTV